MCGSQRLHLAIKVLVSTEVDVDMEAADYKGWTALSKAAARGNVLSAGAAVNAADGSGSRAALLCTVERHPSGYDDPSEVKAIVDKLVAAGASVGSADTALIVNALQGKLLAMNTLLAGAGGQDWVNAVTEGGMSALMAAARHGHVLAVRRLLAAGAKISLLDCEDTSALGYASFDSEAASMAEVV